MLHARKWKKQTANVLRINFIQTTVIYQQVKKVDLQHFENLIHNGQMPESEKKQIADNLKIIFIQIIATYQKLKKADLQHFEKFYSDNCYMPQRKKKQTLIYWGFNSQLLDAIKWKKADPNILRIWSTIAIYWQKVKKVDSNILTIFEWLSML